MNHDTPALQAALYEETVLGGGCLSFILRRGQTLRITDLAGGANVSLMLLNAEQPSERLNLPDTLTAPPVSVSSPYLNWRSSAATVKAPSMAAK